MKETARLAIESSVFDGRVLLGLDKLGLNPVWQRHEEKGSRAGVWLIGCEPGDDTARCCTACGAAGRIRSSWLRRFAHTPVGQHAVHLMVRVRRYECVPCARSWTDDLTRVAPEGRRLTEAAVWWAAAEVVLKSKSMLACARERWHRTLKQWLAARPLARDLDELNAQLDGFRREYNEERPHRALNRHAPKEAYEAKGKAGPDPEIAVREQARRDEEARAANERDAAEGKTRRRRPVPVAERTEPVRVDVTVPAKPHKVSKDGCIAQKGIAGGRRTVNVGRENAGKIVELEITHGTIIVVDPATGEILADQTLDATRDYQYRKPMPGVNHAPRQM